MQYYISLPKGWTSQRQWPILVVAEAAEKEYKANAMRFVAARGDLPYIIVAPFIVTNGNQGRRDPAIFPYNSATWDIIEKQGNCSFDMEGVEHIVRDVQEQYHGESKITITGFEAGAHLVWAIVFHHPEMLVAAIPVAGNYIGRCVEESQISTHPSRVQLPIHALQGAQNSLWASSKRLYGQWLEAKKLAQKHGYTNISEHQVPGKEHIPLPEEVFAYCATLQQNQTKPSK